MVNFKIVISDPKTKEAFQKEVDQGQSGILGKKIGDKFSGNSIGLTGYELVITGGSDKDGFPMRRDVEGSVRKKVLLAFPPGFHPRKKGQRRRKSIRGNTISAQISQINTKVITYGSKSLEELLGVKEKAKEKKPKKEKPEEKPKEAVKEEKPPEAEEKKEEKPERKEKPKEGAKKDEKPEEAEKKMGIKKLEEVEKEKTGEKKEGKK